MALNWTHVCHMNRDDVIRYCRHFECSEPLFARQKRQWLTIHAAAVSLEPWADKPLIPPCCPALAVSWLLSFSAVAC
jgi:hypothetical protein